MDELNRVQIAEALERRYLMREIVSIDSVSLKFGFVDFEVQTTSGPESSPCVGRKAKPSILVRTAN